MGDSGAGLVLDDNTACAAFEHFSHSPLAFLMLENQAVRWVPRKLGGAERFGNDVVVYARVAEVAVTSGNSTLEARTYDADEKLAGIIQVMILSILRTHSIHALRISALVRG